MSALRQLNQDEELQKSRLAMSQDRAALAAAAGVGRSSGKKEKTPANKVYYTYILIRITYICSYTVVYTCIYICMSQKRRAYWDGSSPASSSSHSSDPSQSASTSQHLPSPHDPLTPHTPLAPLTPPAPPVVDYTEVFAFDQIALSSELEKTTTLEAFIPDEELSGYTLPKGPITPYRYVLSICVCV